MSLAPDTVACCLESKSCCYMTKNARRSGAHGFQRLRVHLLKHRELPCSVGFFPGPSHWWWETLWCYGHSHTTYPMEEMWNVLEMTGLRSLTSSIPCYCHRARKAVPEMDPASFILAFYTTPQSIAVETPKYSFLVFDMLCWFCWVKWKHLGLGMSKKEKWSPPAVQSSGRRNFSQIQRDFLKLQIQRP